ncbi:MAG: YIP1 family protein, partial [Arenicella sp.]|nr:YIP1 family protein [Arenicella sp.]
MPESNFSLSTVIDDAKKVITDPFGFYRAMPDSGGFADPVIFVAVMGAAAGLIFSVLAMIGLGGAGGMGMAGGMALSAVILVPIGMIIGSFIGAAIVFVIWKLMGSDKNYETAYRCVAYSTAIMPVVALISMIPYVATLVRTLWGMMLL